MIDPITGAIVAGVLGKVVNDFCQSDKLSSQASEKKLKINESNWRSQSGTTSKTGRDKAGNDKIRQS